MIDVEPGAEALQLPAGRMVAVLEEAWQAIANRHPELPAVVVVLGAGSDRRQGLFKWGHYARLRWQGGEQALAELLVAGEGLARGVEEVFGTLLHEGAHCLADRRGLGDTSRDGRYHNARYRDVAAELGLEVAQTPSYGWATTRLRPETAAAYGPELERLRGALTIYRVAESQGRDASAAGGPGGGDRRRSANLLPAVCGCPRRIRIARSTLATGPITCGLCGQPFVALEATAG
jgi:hypothetical protein